MKDDESATVKMEQVKLEDVNDLSPAMVASPIDTTAAIKQEEAGASLPPHDDEKIPVQAADAPQSAKSRYSRQPSSKVTARQPPLFDHYPNMTAEASMAFQVIPDCLYGSKNMGSTDNDAFDCDCREEWQDGENIACGEDSDCINRATKMECSAAAGNCGGGCQNQRFQRKQYADVSVIKTEKKGYGLRADMELHANDFIFEYIGEVINEPTFRRRMLQYDEEGIKHFYFMSLTKSEFVDATRKGNLGRFCNHSCNPNCFVDKWVVGDKLRMGIFALRTIRAGEELVFNYNVDRYGADPQPCYCGEPNCVGFIGGKTQTERATKLPTATIEALGIDFGDGWDTAVAKKPRKKKADEDDEEYVSSLQQKPLNGDDVKKVMASLLQCKEKWIAVKLLERIQRCHEEKIIHNVVRMHAYEILKTTLNNFGEDRNVDIQVLSILDSFPRLTRNKIQDSKIEVNVQMLASSEDREVAEKAQQLLESWSKLTVAYRIRRRKLDENAPQQNIYEDRRGQAREEETTQLQNKAPTQTIDAPKGPRSTVPQRHNNFYHGAPRPRRPNPNTPLPQGWFSAKDASNNTYYYDKSGTTTWQRPTQPAGSVSKTQSKAIQEQLAIQSIIDRVTKEGTPKQTTPQAMQLSDPPSKESKKDKWRTLPIDKQMKIYENTVFPPVKYVLDKFRHKLPKEELKRFGKDLAKKLVASDYKNNRVTDPTATLSDKQNKKIKVYVKDFLDRAVQKYDAQQKKSSTHASHKPVEQSQRPDKLAKSTPNSRTSPLDSPLERKDIAIVDDDNTPHSGMEDDESEPRKRKREDNESEGADLTPSEGPDLKRVRDDDASQPSPPPPPPPPPAETAVEAGDITEEEKALYEQEEALMRENEEAQRLEDEANQTKQMEDAVKAISRGGAATPVGGAADNDASNLEEHGQNRKHEVLSH